ncbi:MAG TPA: IPT/TIG domain-containing protein [Jatrophihabitans sp.]|jgi:hypothetical protein|uniref:IPT/TIG domain-containing protein n=1 Tax=Jatrophihabitans sp. TaxID=1932789 RepID=UPI002E011ABB|nr:IPT/TIG domain-containing protein [Jatrophihabitans sp.]
MRLALACRNRTVRSLVVAALVAATVSAVVVDPAPSGADTAGSGSITLDVRSARSVNPASGYVHKGDIVNADAAAGSKYKWMINVDDTGNPGTAASPGTDTCLPGGANYDPTACQWPSTRVTSGYAPIIAQGDDTDLNPSKALGNLPSGKYLISVTAAGFKIDGAHFTVTNGSNQMVSVAMQPLPLPLTTLRIEVFNDNLPVDATWEMDAEQGLRNFSATITDVFGLVSTDYYGNALCTRYLRVTPRRGGGTANLPAPVDSPLAIAFDANNRPLVDKANSVGKCLSDTSGQIIIPNLGPDRYAATVAPPAPVAGQTYRWVQTTTLEGGHDHDIWPQEGETGYDTEQTKGAELVPPVQFGFVRTMPIRIPTRGPVPTGEVKGVVVAGLPYIGGQNGQVVPETGLAGAKFGGPIANPWVALSDLGAGDQEIYAGRGGADGSFDIKNVPDGTYQLSVWDDDQDYILWSFNVEVDNGGLTDVGNEMIVGWFTHVYGHVFVDSNGNGKQDPGERGVPQFALTVRERDNTTMDQATNTVSTDTTGAYNVRETYPLGKFLVLEGFNTRYRTTGITYKGENETKPTTQLGSLVDINFLPIIGLGGEIDWGVQPYNAGTNGGIVGTVSYDTTRNELDPADAVSETYQPGIPDVKVHLNLPVACSETDPAVIRTRCRQGYELDPATGAMLKGPEVQDAYTSEKWDPPRGCRALQYDGTPVAAATTALPPAGDKNYPCVEAPMDGVAIGASDSAGGSQTVNGNYGFATSKINLYAPGDPKNPAPNHDLALYANLGDNGYPEQDLPAEDYLVSVDIPNNPVGGKPMYKVTSEEDVNIFDGDSYLPQENFPPTTTAAANDPAGPGGPDAPSPTPPSQPPSQQAGIISPCAGALHTVKVTDQAFLDGGGSPFEGMPRPSCQDKLVTVRAGQATAPNFNLFTDVPLPSHFWGLTLNDLGLTLDPRSVNFGEALGIPNVPVGLYDYSGRLVDTTHTDFNGLYEALEPSTDTYNCPVPAGPCPNMYHFVGNDPGQPGALNADYNPRYRTIATNFQGWPGQYTVTDEAPTQVAATALAPDSTVANTAVCDLGPKAPQLLAVDKPYVYNSAGSTVTITGFGFGATQGTGTVKVNGASLGTAVQSWSDTKIVVSLPSGTPAGPRTMSITADNGLTSYNGLTFQVFSTTGTRGASAANPLLYEVGPGKAYTTVQAAIEAATPTSALRYRMVVVWPNAQTQSDPRGEYTENVILHHQIKIQGVGPGGFQPDGTFVPGSILDGSGFNPDTAAGTAWVNLLGRLRYSGDPAVPDAAVITVLDDPGAPTVPAAWPTSIDGLQVTGGSQSDFVGNVNEISGVNTTAYGASGALITQGGGIYVHNNVRNLQVTDNVIQGNSGSYGGAVRVGTPYDTPNGGDDRNYGLYLANNQIRDNGGTNLAGGIGLFSGSDGYRVTNNAICGNFSAEYGGGVSAFGYNANVAAGSTNSIDHNRIWFNQSYDEGGGVFVAGELPADPNGLSEGSGPVTIDANVIQTNLANDDGGGIRLLQTSGSHVTATRPETIAITNNTVANNVSAHEGGGIALDDAAFVNIVNDTVTRNLTTATAVTSDGTPAPAGLSTAANSDPLQARLCSNSRVRNADARTVAACTAPFSNPTLTYDVFWENRAGTFDGGTVSGITAGDANFWDMGVADTPGAVLAPTNSLLQTPTSQPAPGGSGNTTDLAPRFVDSYDVTVNILASRSYPAFRQSAIVAQILPPSLMGNYHLGTGSPARGTPSATRLANIPAADIDGNPRPSVTGTTRNPLYRYDAGSDQMTP